MGIGRADFLWGQISKHSKMINSSMGSKPDGAAKPINCPLISLTAWIRSLSFLTAYFCEQGLLVSASSRD
jgi:hypothetical protein